MGFCHNPYTQGWQVWCMYDARVQVHAWMLVYTFMHARLCTYAHMHTCVHVYIHVCMYVKKTIKLCIHHSSYIGEHMLSVHVLHG